MAIYAPGLRDRYLLLQDATFKSRLQVQIITTAITIYNNQGSFSAPSIAMAKNVLQAGSQNYVNQFAEEAVTDPGVANAFVIASPQIDQTQITDANINAMVTAFWPKIAGG